MHTGSDYEEGLKAPQLSNPNPDLQGRGWRLSPIHLTQISSSYAVRSEGCDTLGSWGPGGLIGEDRAQGGGKGVLGTHVTCQGEPIGRHLDPRTHSMSIMKLSGPLQGCGPRSLIPNLPPEEQAAPQKPVLYNANNNFVTIWKQGLCTMLYMSMYKHFHIKAVVYLVSLIFAKIL